MKRKGRWKKERREKEERRKKTERREREWGYSGVLLLTVKLPQFIERFHLLP